MSRRCELRVQWCRFRGQKGNSGFAFPGEQIMKDLRMLCAATLLFLSGSKYLVAHQENMTEVQHELSHATPFEMRE